MRSPFELKSLVEWLEKQPGDETYPFWDGNCCLLGQYARHLGIERPYPGTTRWAALPETLRTVWNLEIGEKHPRTFGAALTRARALLAREPAP